MRERRPSDWVTDLAGRHELERRVAHALEGSTAVQLLEADTHRFDRLDYTVATKRVPRAQVELKAKWQSYRGWSKHRPDVDETDLFILDELALRRIISGGAYTHLIIYDHPASRWVLFGVADLVLAPKARVVRQLSGRRPTSKGKVLLDVNDGHNAGQLLPAAIDRLAESINDTDRRWLRVEPWPSPRTDSASR